MSRHRSHPGRARRRAEARLERLREYLSLLEQGRLEELRAELLKDCERYHKDPDP